MTRIFPDNLLPSKEYAPPVSLLDAIKADIAALPSTGAFGEVGATAVMRGTLFITQYGARGDVAYFSGGGIGASRFGQGVEQGNAAKARRLVEGTPDADICIVNGSSAVIIERATRKVRRAQQIQRF